MKIDILGNISQKKKILRQSIPTINASELTQEIFEQLSDNYRKPVVIKGYLKESDCQIMG